jgi:DnaJ-class molecular chaperone
MYHPDFQASSSEMEQEKSSEKFKNILKAYETLANPISRQAYDLENQINQGVNLDQATYEDSTTKQNYFQPKT